MTSRPTIGFIGLGLLGGAMAQRLLAQGFEVVGHDLATGRVEALQASGLAAASSAAEVARRADIVLLCVTTTAAVIDVVGGANGLLSAQGARVGVVVDHSTTEIDATRDLAARLRAAGGVEFVDAPVSGGPAAALGGTLAIMAGGGAEAIARVRPVVETLGRFTHMGEVGAGQATKLVNQTLVLTNYCVIAEALRLAQAYGVDPTRIATALETGHAGSNLLPVLLERMIAEDFAPRGYARQVLKDLEMLHDASRDAHLAMPMASQALSLFRLLVAQGKGELDGAAVLSLLPAPHREASA